VKQKMNSKKVLNEAQSPTEAGDGSHVSEHASSPTRREARGFSVNKRQREETYCMIMIMTHGKNINTEEYICGIKVK